MLPHHVKSNNETIKEMSFMSDYIFGKKQPPHKRWAVAWYNPFVLYRSVREMLATNDQIRNLDRREMYSPEFKLIQVAEEQRDGDYWWDFVSDTGDGGNATFTVAREIQKDFIARAVCSDIEVKEVLPEKFPSGELLVLGGDLAYPGASVEEYQYRLTEMWVAASSNPDAQRDRDTLKPSLVIPQNHDWFDNISTFTRYFVDTRTDTGIKVMSAETEPDVTPIGTRKLQKHSYFAARLPNNWIILGFDFALVCDIDRQQFAAFFKLFKDKKITPEDNLILLYPEPYWTRNLGDDAREGYPKRYQRLEALMLKLGCRIRLRLAGDIHHYARETAKADTHFQYDDMLITSGGGGAFLHPTHTNNVNKVKAMSLAGEDDAMTEDLRERVRIGITKPKEKTIRSYEDKVFYPRKKQSRGLLLQNIVSFFRSTAHIGKQLRDCRTIAEHMSVSSKAIIQGNVMFSVVLGAILWAAIFTQSIIPGLIVTLLFFSICKESSLVTAFIGGLAGLGLVLFIEHQPSWILQPGFIPNEGEGILNCAYLYAWRTLLFGYCFVLAGLFTGVLFSLFSLFGFLPNNAFSPLGYEGFKSFIRFRIDAEGNLHGYVWGTNDVPRYWVNNPDAQQPVWVEKDKRKSEWEIKDLFVLHK
jgi:urease gamma subunit